jgi:hypothetical protein
MNVGGTLEFTPVETSSIHAEANQVAKTGSALR